MLGPNTANFGRVVVAVLLLGTWAFTLGLGFAGGAFGWFFLSGVVGFGLGDMALFHAFPRLGARLCSLLINCLAAPFAALIEWGWLGTGLSATQTLCGAAILAGVGLALAPEQRRDSGGSGRTVGIAYGVLAGLGQGLGAVLSRKAYAAASAGGWSIDGGTAAFQRILGGLLIVSAPVLWLQIRQVLARRPVNELVGSGRPGLDLTESAPSPDSETEAFVAAVPGRKFTAWWWVLLNGLAGPALGVGFYQWALRITPSGLVLAITSTTPLVVIPFAYWLEGDRPGPRSLAGAVLAVGGVIGLTITN